tara:strand:- start:2293 stop:2976 length:684 start_codon:yes stop_codon:yes gene_type:complete
MNDKKIIIALDSDNLKEIISIVKLLKGETFAFKIGYQFFFNFGLTGYNLIKKQNVKIFLDFKLHDIPNTVQNGIKTISSNLKPYFTTIHISGGDKMQQAANIEKNKIKILGVSMLTSLDSIQTKKYYFNDNIENIVSRFAEEALKNNLDGVVCSPKEIKIIKKKTLGKILIITPGIRPSSYKEDDQKRTMTPEEAIDIGADFLVIGRPITQSISPLESIKMINAKIN